jgi:hypothetical protein
MKWSDVGISFGSEDHPDTELFDRNLPFVVKIPIGRHKVAKTLIDSGASFNLMMRKTFIEMSLNFIEVASFDIRYNCIPGRPFLLKFMAVIHTAYATMKMLGPKGVITLKSNQRDALACENKTLTNIRRFGEKEAQELAAKVAKTHGGSTPVRIVASKPPTGGTLRSPAEKKNIFVGSTSDQPTTNQVVDDKKKGSADKEVAVDPDDTEKKLHLSTMLDAKYELALVTFLRENLDVFTWQISDMFRILRKVIEHKLGIDPVFKSIK